MSNVEFIHSDDKPKQAEPVKKLRFVLNKRGQEFLLAKGIAFREKWRKKLEKGVTQEEFILFNTMCNAFHTPPDVVE